MQEHNKTNIMKRLLIIILLSVSLGLIAYYNWNRKTTSLQNANPEYSIASSQLFLTFEQDEVAANKQFLNKVLEVKGKVKEVHKESNGDYVITLEGSELFGVICRMESGYKIDDPALTGKNLALKGLCTGMLMDVVMVQCVTSEK